MRGATVFSGAVIHAFPLYCVDPSFRAEGSPEVLDADPLRPFGGVRALSPSPGPLHPLLPVVPVRPKHRTTARIAITRLPILVPRVPVHGPTRRYGVGGGGVEQFKRPPHLPFLPDHEHSSENSVFCASFLILFDFEARSHFFFVA